MGLAWVWRGLAVMSCVVCAGASGCTPHAFSPPAQALRLDSAATLPQGDYEVGLEAGSHAAVFWPEVASFHGGVRTGLEDDLQLSMGGLLLRVDDAPRGTHPYIYALRGGLGYAVIRHFALDVGIGAGGSKGGAFVSPDLGAVVAYENEYLVPFLSAHVYLSQPVFARRVLLEVELDEEDGRVERWDTPMTTGGLQASTGLRLPLYWAGRQQGSVHLGVGLTVMADRDDNIGYLGGAVGLSLRL